MTPDDNQPGDKRDRAGTPRIEDLLTADEGPMRRDLLRQIATLERRLNEIRLEHAPYEPMPEREESGPAMLSTAQLEHVRDDLLETINGLQDHVAGRFVGEIVDPPADLSDPLRGVINPWAEDPTAPWRKRLFQRVRRALRDPRAR